MFADDDRQGSSRATVPVCNIVHNIIRFINILNFKRFMEKKELKFYVTPVAEAMEVLTQGFLCGSTGNAEGITDPTPDPENDFDLD